MNWFFIVIVAHLLNAAVFVIDKYLLCSRITKPLVYAFYLGILSLLVLILIPFGGLVLPNTIQLIINLASGSIYILALISFYYALKAEEPSRVVPVVGGFVPIFTIFLSCFLLGERLKGNVLWAVIFLIVGGILLAIRKFSISQKLLKNFVLWLSASFLFALSYVLIKFVFIHQPFVSGFIWARIGGFLTALVLLVIPEVRKSIFSVTKSIKANTSFLFLGNQAMGAAGFILLNYAIALTSVSVVNALQGIQYIFILILAIILGRYYSQALIEKATLLIILQKIIAIILISLGVIILFI
ncbi:MAG: EamA family transporter [Patescibacteria group bacterium]